jgi:hypothetical protein
VSFDSVYAGSSRRFGCAWKPQIGRPCGRGCGDERETTVVPERRRRRPGRLDAGPFVADIASFRLHLAAENKAAGTIRIYTEAPLWFAAAYLLRDTDKTRWE